ncbi:MAG: TetR/AcrR family transcriptional regulator [FCB group bacterium]|nr:TetR/AcrR family transcriptional regulator [FCB group bacterium]
MDQKRENILLVAEGVFARYGIRKTTMDDIAKGARLAKSSLYYYFKSKEDIFTEVVRKDAKKFQKNLSTAIDKATDPQDKISAYVVARIQNMKDLSNYYVTLTDEYLEQYGLVEKARSDFMIFEIKTLSGLIEAGVSEGVFDVPDPGITAKNFAIALKGLEYALLTESKDGNIKLDCQPMLDLLFRGIISR